MSGKWENKEKLKIVIALCDVRRGSCIVAALYLCLGWAYKLI